MTDLRKAAEMALHGLLDAREVMILENNDKNAYQDEIEALRQALAHSANQSDCGHNEYKKFCQMCMATRQKPVKCTCGYAIGHPLVSKCICSPPNPWVGLTDEELSGVYNEHYTEYVSDNVGIVDVFVIARAVEAKLKEKNT